MARAYLNDIEGEGELIVRRTRHGIFIRGTWISLKFEAGELISGGTYLYVGPIRDKSRPGQSRAEVKVQVVNFQGEPNFDAKEQMFVIELMAVELPDYF